jgi:hypothetical protein
MDLPMHWACPRHQHLSPAVWLSIRVQIDSGWGVCGYYDACQPIMDAMISGSETWPAVQLRPRASLVLSRGLAGRQKNVEPSLKAPLACAS